MYFKIEKGTNTHNSLEELFEKINKCNLESISFVEKLGYKKHGKKHGVIAGGISCIESENKPEGFKTVGKKHQNLIFPKAGNKKLLAQINNLPTVSFKEFNDAIGFKSQFVGLTHHRACGCDKQAEIYLIEVDDRCIYTPKKDMIEILASEFIQLKKAGNEL